MSDILDKVHLLMEYAFLMLGIRIHPIADSGSRIPYVDGGEKMGMGISSMDFNKPGPNKRVCAFFIDSIIAQVCGGIISLILAKDISWLIWVVIILFKDCLNGQSVGKYLVGTQIVDEDNVPAKPSKTIIRNIFMIIPIFPIIEYVRMLRDKEEGKRIGDNVAKTKVNDLKPQMSDNIFLWISLLLAIVVVLIQLGIGALLIHQHPELLKKS